MTCCCVDPYGISGFRRVSAGCQIHGLESLALKSFEREHPELKVNAAPTTTHARTSPTIEGEISQCLQK